MSSEKVAVLCSLESAKLAAAGYEGSSPNASRAIRSQRRGRSFGESAAAALLGGGTSTGAQIAPEGKRFNEGAKQLGSGAAGALAGGAAGIGAGGSLGYAVGGESGAVLGGGLGGLVGGLAGNIKARHMRARRATDIHTGRRALRKEMASRGEDTSGLNQKLDARVRGMGVKAVDPAASTAKSEGFSAAGAPFGGPGQMLGGYVGNRTYRDDVQDYGNALRTAVSDMRKKRSTGRG